MGETVTKDVTKINTLATKVKKYISDNNTSIAGFAKEAGYTRETVSRYLNGKYRNNPDGIEASLTAFLEAKAAGNVAPELETNAAKDFAPELETNAAKDFTPELETNAAKDFAAELEAKVARDFAANTAFGKEMATGVQKDISADKGEPDEAAKEETSANGADTAAAMVAEGAHPAAVMIAEGAHPAAAMSAESVKPETAAMSAEAPNPQQAFSETKDPVPRRRRRGPKKSGFFESEDAKMVTGVCQACQEYNEMGIITGRSGFGKTYALKEYAKLPRVAYIECDVTMGTKDLLKDIEKALDIPHLPYGTNHDRVNGIIDFLTINKGYLIIVDEADKLMNKRSQDKMQIIRRIFDGTVDDSDTASCGIVIAGEPRLEAQVKVYLEQYAKRTVFGAELEGLSALEVKSFLQTVGCDIEETAVNELVKRACNQQTGCFRLLDRTMRNVTRKLEECGETTVTLKIINQASSLMML